MPAPLVQPLLASQMQHLRFRQDSKQVVAVTHLGPPQPIPLRQDSEQLVANLQALLLHLVQVFPVQLLLAHLVQVLLVHSLPATLVRPLWCSHLAQAPLCLRQALT